MEYKTPLQRFKKAIWQYSSEVLEVILFFGSVILTLVCNPKKKIKNVDKVFHRESHCRVIRAKQKRSKGNNQNV